MIRIFLIIQALLAVSCSTPEKVAGPAPFPPQVYGASYAYYQGRPKVLTQRELEYDWDYFLVGFSGAYIGNHVNGKEVKDRVQKEVSALNTDIQADKIKEMDFFIRLQKILSMYPDKHLGIGNLYSSAKKNKSEDELKELFSLTETNDFGVIRVKTFMPPNEKEYKAFISKVKNGATNFKGLIIDLRGNSGGRWSYALDIYNSLADKESDLHWPKRIGNAFFVSNEYAKTMQSNISTLQWLLKENPNEDSDFLIDLAQMIKEGKKIGEVNTGTIDSAQKSPPLLLEGKPIIIIQDSNCASACELLTLLMSESDNVRTLGKNTAGALHFVGIGLMVLPYSKFTIHVPTAYLEFTDKKSIEFKGLAPHITFSKTIPPMVQAIQLLKRKNNSK